MEKQEYYIDLNNKAEKMLRKGEFLGSGHNGIVYLLPDKKVIKIFKEKKVCKKEREILQKTNNSKYFPKVYDYGDYFILREYIRGERLDHYIKQNGINKRLTHNIIKLIKEFERLKFKKLDIRCKDIYVDKKYKLRIIDPKNNYSKTVVYPRHLMKGLNKLKVLDDFLIHVEKEEPKYYDLWSTRMKEYLEKGIK
ncbi:protein kinase [Clostridium botulinum]|uniref:serine/threonine protein kinase n=1 Tax=Clostridium botulinum TaxID=1491 RepID=UPI0001F84D71|nr:serine/threonine protein kinase [Clostridium botulinum]KEI99035.1 protein kinase [Clostridium botulinum A2B3 87]KEJ02189.1 protein kinase [Clostridium botulinum F 357]MBE1302545.1 protein kinase [Clostridium botulinum]MCC5417717.1 protein kinase [Clostridium botulinum]MCJ8171560.1 protein kinase [Clostridium botulinum]